MKFSNKYAPLFDLLQAWDKKHESDYYKELSQVDTVCLSGGRDSGKSFALSTWNVLASYDYGHRILYTRQTMASTDNSIGQALENRMLDLGLSDQFLPANNNYTLKNGDKGKISITGQKTSSGTQTAKLKSLEDYSVFETDEAEELVGYDEWRKIKRSMRAQDVQCLSIISFNPPTREHWIAQEFYDDVPDGFNGIKDGILYIHTTYLDNGKDNMAEHNWNEYEQLREYYEQYISTPIKERDTLPKKVINGFKSYKYDILGGFKNRAEGVVFDDWSTGEFDTSLPHLYGQDYGFAVEGDPTTLIKIAIDQKRKKIYVHEELYQNNMDTDAIAKVNKQIAGHVLIVADSAEERLISDLKKKGNNIIKCVKGPGSVNAGIKLLQEFEIIVTPESTNVIKEFNNYIWNDKKTKIQPIDDWNHAIDPIRYVAGHLLQRHKHTGYKRKNHGR